MSFLFSPAALGQISLKNRIIVPPMCQYSAIDGMPTAWHHSHYMNLALSGASLVIVEASAVTPAGRITYKDLGIWNDEQATALKNMLADIRQFADARLGIQIAHAGRKASTDLPWLGGQSLSKQEQNGWETVSASNLPFGHSHPPRELSKQEIHDIQQQLSMRLNVQNMRDLMLLKSMQPTVIYCINFYRQSRTSAKMNMGAILKTAVVY